MFKNNGSSRIGKFENMAIENSDMQVDLPGGKCYFSERMDANNNTFLAAWVIIMGLSLYLRIDETETGALARIKTVADDPAEVYPRYRALNGRVPANIRMEEYKSETMEKPLPAGTAQVYLDIPGIANAIAEAIRNGEEYPINHQELGIKRISEEEIEKRKTAAAEKRAGSAPAGTGSSLPTAEVADSTEDYDPFAEAD